MNLLLDTHVYLWVRMNDPRLPTRFRAAVAEPTNVKYVSALTAAEIAVTRAVGKLEIAQDALAPDGLEALGFDELPFTLEHAQVLDRLPLLHRDPFDRMLIAQAIAEDLTFLTVDGKIAPYEVRRLE